MVQETAKSVSDSMAGIYAKPAQDVKTASKVKNSQAINTAIGYDLSKFIGQVFIITSRGKAL